MLKTDAEISTLIDQCRLEEALLAIEERMAEEKESGHLFYLRGKLRLRQNDWRQATGDFLMSQSLWPEGPAAEQLMMIKEIMDFFNKDMYNQ